jgi:hypothetical protein
MNSVTLLCETRRQEAHLLVSLALTSPVTSPLHTVPANLLSATSKVRVMNWKRCGRKWSWPIVGSITGIYLKELRLWILILLFWWISGSLQLSLVLLRLQANVEMVPKFQVASACFWCKMTQSEFCSLHSIRKSKFRYLNLMHFITAKISAPAPARIKYLSLFPRLSLLAYSAAIFLSSLLR